ncbi:hypothetical protein [Streptomyces longispororuber]|uniref:hypothetical protein n=1 Tax=Streptomyces longispororuber TaxID=68230 RepID=UPI00210D9E5E|nr:hypothetical protein [Streptomyces longispororuber]MCQ4207410.1 hypothetical protein [Streptomyces longispororuber]
MTELLGLTGQLRLVGVALIVMGLVHAALPRILGWPADLRASSLLTRQVSYAHLFFIALTCTLLGALPFAFAPALLTGAPLPTFLLCAQTLFWGLRWIMQFAYFSPRLWRGDRLRTAGHGALAVLWTWVTMVFATAAVHALG